MMGPIEECVTACSGFAQCAVDECIGYEQDDFDLLVAGCLETCTAPLAGVFEMRETCAEKLDFVSSVRDGFRTLCDSTTNGYCESYAATCGEWDGATTCEDWYTNSPEGEVGATEGANQECYVYHMNVAMTEAEAENAEGVALHCGHARGDSVCVDPTFCERYVATCGEWTGDTTCEDWFEGSEVGPENATDGNNQSCYNYHLNVAEGEVEAGNDEGVALHCEHARGDAVCVDTQTCENYCSIMEANCSETYESTEACIATCEGFSTEGTEGDASGNTIQCRIYHGGVAAEDADLHCPHAGPDGALVCVDTLTDSGDADASIEAGQSYSLLVSPEARTLYRFETICEDDTVLYLYQTIDGERVLVDENDDGGESNCSLLYIYLEAGATYEVNVTGFGGRAVDFVLQVEAYPTVASGEVCVDNDTIVAGCPETDFCGEEGLCTSRYNEGDACDVSAECSDGTYCFEEVCTVYPVAGGTCDRFNDFCQGETYCFGNFSDGYTCQAYPQLGEVCSDFNDQCQGETYCLDELCVVYPVEGEVCDRFNDQCQGETYCDGNFSDGYLCIPYPQLGEACSSSNDQCQGGTYCFGNFSDGYACVNPPVLGEECDRFDDRCQDGTYCDGTFSDGYFCVNPPVLGEECDTFNDLCAEGICSIQEDDSEICANAPVIGEVCNSNQDLCVESQCFSADDTWGTCTVAPAAEGDACDTTYGCPEGLSCNLELVCAIPVCGDGSWGAAEECDDGNLESGDGCSDTCTVELEATVSGPEPANFNFYTPADHGTNTWSRLGSTCSFPGSSVSYDLFTVNNPTETTMYATVTATWSDDGYLHIYNGSFDADDSTNCVIGDDDYNGTGQSQIAEYQLEAGATMVIVASGYGSDSNIAPYSIDVSLIPPIEVGQACDPNSTPCADGLSCFSEGTDEGVCTVNPAAEGDACDTDFGCPESLSCITEEDSDLGLCQAAICGNGVIESGEECDDGNLENGDGCSAECIADLTGTITEATTLTFYGTLDANDPTWIRPSSVCSSGFADRAYDAFEITNSSDLAMNIDISADYTFDGYMHLFETPFDPTQPTTGCLLGNDDGNSGSLTGDLSSQIAPGETLAIVISPYSTGSGSYTLSVTTSPIAP
jgi:cysteine-rich repeat protein